MKPPTDEQLLVDHVAGRPDAFELIVRRHSVELYRFVHRFTNHSLAADDVVQETFIQVFHSAADFDPRRRFKPWLFTIAANKARDWLRQRSRRAELPLDAQIGGDAGDGEATYAQLLSSDVPEDPTDLQVDEKRRLVRNIVEQLPAMLREVLILAYYHKLPYKEIAEVLHVPVGTVKSRLHAAVGTFGKAYRDALQRTELHERKRE